jgi:hypothetical protein
MKASIISVLALAFGLGTAATVCASPVVYTIHTVASGHLGSVNFTGARMTISFAGNTHNVGTTTVNGHCHAQWTHAPGDLQSGRDLRPLRYATRNCGLCFGHRACLPDHRRVL